MLARGEFQWDRKSLLERAFDWLGEHIDLPGLPGAWDGLQWILLAPLFVATVWCFVLLRRHLVSLRRVPDLEFAQATDELARRVGELLAGARDARAAGDLRLALRLYFFALVVGLGRRGDLEYRDTWTNRELLERGHPTAPVSLLLEPLVGDLDRKGFGLAPTTEQDVTHLADLCARWLQTLPGPAEGGAR